MARQDVCCGKTRSLLWQDNISLAPRHKGIHKGVRREAPRPFVEAARSAASLMSWHKRDLVLPQQRSCLATTHILSCHNRDLVLPQQTLCPPELFLIFWIPLGPFGPNFQFFFSVTCFFALRPPLTINVPAPFSSNNFQACRCSYLFSASALCSHKVRGT